MVASLVHLNQLLLLSGCNLSSRIITSLVQHRLLLLPGRGRGFSFIPPKVLLPIPALESSDCTRKEQVMVMMVKELEKVRSHGWGRSNVRSDSGSFDHRTRWN